MIETIQRVAIAIAVAVAVTGAVQDWSKDVPSVTTNYYQQTQTGGAIEEKYTAMGEYDVSYTDYPARDFLIERHLCAMLRSETTEAEMMIYSGKKECCTCLRRLTTEISMTDTG